ncbi:MAG: aldo/keto reductase [Hyphomonadaceae bacterium]|nr:aldo/keto reductase [Hyphomonadaceae bacterium]
MQYRQLGRTDVRVSSVCLGTMTWGEQNTEAEGHAQLDLALDRGVNFIDTAEMYAVPPRPETQGFTEQIIGTWLKARGGRDRIVLATKIAGRSPMTWTRQGGVQGHDGPLDGGLTRQTRQQIDFAVAQSLKRLQTDYIDLYQLHWPDRGYAGFGFQTYRDYEGEWLAFEDILESLDAHVKAGRIRHIGVSNESPWGVMRFIAESDKRGLPRMASIQNAYNLVNRSFETGGLAEIALREQVGLLAYSPLAQGYLTGKYSGGALPVGSRKQLFQRLQRYEGPGAAQTIDAYVALAAELGVPPAHLAIKFCDAQPWVTSTIIGATTMAQLETDLAAFDLAWTDDLQKRVDALHKAHPNPCP